MISSKSNEKIKEVIKLITSKSYRDKNGLFVVEGLRIVKDTPKEFIKQVFVSESFANKKDCVDNEIIVSDNVFNSMSDAKTSQGILAVVKKEEYNLETILNKDFLIILDGIQDPGNLGTIVRTALATGVGGVILSKGSVDMYNPKVVRSTMSAIFKVPFIYSNNLNEVINLLYRNEYSVYVTALKGAVEYTDIEYKGKIAIIMGNEGNGVSQDIINSVNKKIFIPMESDLESLNVGVATSIISYEIYRQRRGK